MTNNKTKAAGDKTWEEHDLKRITRRAFGHDNRIYRIASLKRNELTGVVRAIPVSKSLPFLFVHTVNPIVLSGRVMIPLLGPWMSRQTISAQYLFC